MSALEFGPADAADLLERLRVRGPRIHCITNSVAEAFTANVLLAAGAVPSMTINPEEVPYFVGRADALLINLGTLGPQRRSAIDAALDIALEEGHLWALDPVFVERSEPRLKLAKALLDAGPSAIRANEAEIAALTGTDADRDAVRQLAISATTVVAVTGEVDLVTDGVRSASIANGHALMRRVTAMGCAVTALMAGYLTLTDDHLHAAAACLAFAGVAAEAAAERAQGPGSFVPAFLDALYSVGPEDVASRARIS